ncbi:MAG: SMP-30/gluconolactonase/LRE family protein [Spirochaetales bacterium]|nr:SMP-30/gluconolactonase/LRE family protein [Spirochaetales bacterium]
MDYALQDVDFSELSLSLQELAEGPRWQGGSFYWCNITRGEVWKWTPDLHFFNADSAEKPLLPALSKPELLVKASSMVGAFCFDREERLILLTEKGLELYEGEGESRLLLPVSFKKGGRFNDCIVDPSGRILAGTLYPDHEGGALFSFSPDGKGGFFKGEELLSGIKISNGMAFSADGRRFYHTDTARGTIISYEYLEEEGLLGGIQDVIKIEPEMGGPDGMIMDDGVLWTALWGGSAILLLSTEGVAWGKNMGRSEGRILGKIECPALQPTSIALSPVFDDRRMILVTTAAYGAVDGDNGLSPQGEFLGGKIYIAVI